MEIRRESKKGTVVSGIDPVLAEFEAEIAWRRVASTQGAIAGRVADLCDDDLL